MLATGDANTLVVLRGAHTSNQRTYIPHEVKSPWAEAHKGDHFADLLMDKQSRPRVARPAAQILSYMVRRNSLSTKGMYGFQIIDWHPLYTWLGVASYVADTLLVQC